jgi:hypothetical protein
MFANVMADSRVRIGCVLFHSVVAFLAPIVAEVILYGYLEQDPTGLRVLGPPLGSWICP